MPLVLSACWVLPRILGHYTEEGRGEPGVPGVHVIGHVNAPTRQTLQLVRTLERADSNPARKALRFNGCCVPRKAVLRIGDGVRIKAASLQLWGERLREVEYVPLDTSGTFA